MKRWWILAAVFLIGMTACDKHRQDATAGGTSATDAAPPVTGSFTSQELAQFAALEPIDAHAHVFEVDPAFNAMLKQLHVRLMDILVVDDQGTRHKDLKAESQAAWKFVKSSGGQAVECTTFDPYKVNQPGFVQGANKWLDSEFAQGAVAVKLWKNVGMEIKDAKGNYILPDDPVFAPIYKNIAAHHKTLVAHVADPHSSWMPMDPASPDYSYYKDNPVWYMYDKPHPASKEQILAARDHVVEQNPDLRVVGAHLGSMEADFHQLAEHLDRYPNFAVDMAARMPYLMLQPRPEMIAFLTKYQDRLIYATDLGYYPKEDVQAAVKEWQEYYARDWRYLATNDTLEYKGKRVQGLALPDAVLKKLYHDNAAKWFPGIAGGGN